MSHAPVFDVDPVFETEPIPGARESHPWDDDPRQITWKHCVRCGIWVRWSTGRVIEVRGHKDGRRQMRPCDEELVSRTLRS